MTRTPSYLITGAGGGVGGVSRLVVEQLLSHGAAVRAMVHRDDSRADALRALGAEVIVGDLTNPVDVSAAMFGIGRMFFNMSVSADYLEATAVVCAAAEDGDGLEVLVNMSQMTVSQMTATSTEESRQQRLHWLAEHVIGWSGLPAVQIRPTVFLDNPLFTVLPSPLNPRERAVGLAVRKRPYLPCRCHGCGRRRCHRAPCAAGPHRCGLRIDRAGSAGHRWVGRAVRESP
jgi:hypothetical protein